MNKILLAILVVAILFIASTQVTVFVVQPIGAVPEGKTVIIPRTGKLKFIDSADAICEREMSGVSLLCRGMALAQIANSKILLRLPYSETLYLWSTGGKAYDR